MSNYISILNEAIGVEASSKARSALRLSGYEIYRGDSAKEQAELYRLREQVRRFKEACQLVLDHMPVGGEMFIGGKRIDHTGANVARRECLEALTFSSTNRGSRP